MFIYLLLFLFFLIAVWEFVHILVPLNEMILKFLLFFSVNNIIVKILKRNLILVQSKLVAFKEQIKSFEENFMLIPSSN